MEFGILFTSHPNTEAEPYPHRDVHARVTQQILRADELGLIMRGSPSIILAMNTASCPTYSSMRPILQH